MAWDFEDGDARVWCGLSSAEWFNVGGINFFVAIDYAASGFSRDSGATALCYGRTDVIECAGHCHRSHGEEGRFYIEHTGGDAKSPMREKTPQKESLRRGCGAAQRERKYPI